MLRMMPKKTSIRLFENAKKNKKSIFVSKLEEEEEEEAARSSKKTQRLVGQTPLEDERWTPEDGIGLNFW